jgi:hypothetical protein
MGDERRARFWIHAVTMLPLPFIGVMAVRGTVVALGGGSEGILILSDPRAGALALGGFLVPFFCAALTWAPVRSLRGVGYLGYSLALSVAFSVGAVLAVIGLAAGHDARFDALTWTLLVGSFVSGASLLPLAHLIVTDWRSSRRTSDAGRPTSSDGG